MTVSGRLLALCLLVAVTAGAMPGRRDVLQDVPRLTWLTPGFLPADGLVTLGVSGSFYGSEYNPKGYPLEYSVTQLRLFAHWTPWPGVALSWGQNVRRWSNYVAGTAWASAGAGSSGLGLADGDWRAAVALPSTPRWLGVVAWGGSNLPVGSADLGEGVVSPELGGTVAVAVWRDSRLPEMRLHASLGRRWNRSEDVGFGVNLAPGPQPWSPQYPRADGAFGDASNDFRFWGAGLEFRRGSTALWLEYTDQQLWRSDLVRAREDNRILAAGLRWGLEEGWAIHADYQVSLARDDAGGTDWYPASPDLAYTLGVSRQFGWGGRDRDHDGIADRRDLCPGEPEDRDGFQDDDGCPDLDNDQDGIPDRIDLAPDAAEDFDGYLDRDGVPDPDNDGDGIPDVVDQCPDEPEDLDGYKDTDGCPDEFIDTDGDGIADEDDLCPDSAEDLDGFEDADGCPDPDNDFDGIDDAVDQCPDEPEDYDGDRDADGCPDLTEAEAAAQAEAAAKADATPKAAPRPPATGRR
ncbi:MAG: hypothetical protein R3D98_02685 [Candidatus Krumholzibacteriia bacterium]